MKNLANKLGAFKLPILNFALGLLLMLAALFLVIQNLNDQRTAGIESAKALR